ncbi:MAG: hypothetical protein GY790_01315 [Bacteroidetes bacterium]|nr:hypothetical protein [Bacteroidota bacterium]
MKILLLLIMVMGMTGIYAQESTLSIRVVDIENSTALVRSPSSSSSTSCNSPDFPVIRGGSRKDINFNDISWITVRHDRQAKNSDIYVAVDLTLISGVVEEVEMIKNIRITGKSDAGDFSIMIKEINTLQVMHGPA